MDQLTGLRLDARALRVLAHPLRARLLARLRVDGPATATTLAQALGTNSGATSYHLRQLESVGLVADTGEGSGKQRLWKAATDYHSFHPEDFAGDPDAEASLSWLQQHYIGQLTDKARHWLDVASSWPVPWREVLGGGDWLVEVDTDQLQQLNDELDALIKRYRTAGRDRPGARQVAVNVYAFPIDVDEVPAP